MSLRHAALLTMMGILVVAAIPAEGASSLSGRVKKLERQVKRLYAKPPLLAPVEDERRSLPAPEQDSRYYSGTAYCSKAGDPANTILAGGVKWKGLAPPDARIIESYPSDNGWHVRVFVGEQPLPPGTRPIIILSCGGIIYPRYDLE